MASLIRRTPAMRVMEPQKAHRLHFFRTGAERRCTFPSSPPARAVGNRMQIDLGGYHACF
jgi:hypothetical protein